MEYLVGPANVQLQKEITQVTKLIVFIHLERVKLLSIYVAVRILVMILDIYVLVTCSADRTHTEFSCQCRAGYTGPKCDRCDYGYYGLNIQNLMSRDNDKRV